MLILAFIFTPFVLIVWFTFIDPAGYALHMVTAERWYHFQEAINVWVRIATGVLSGLMYFAVAIRGSGGITGEKDKDSWISLLGTPMSSEEILSGKWWGCILSVRRVLFVILLIWSLKGVEA